MGNIQHQIEDMLKHRVRENYNLFMHANEEIEQVGDEMKALRALIETTQQLLQDVSHVLMHCSYSKPILRQNRLVLCT
jgi:peptidoglycan hydrolase CwlO-like protein